MMVVNIGNMSIDHLTNTFEPCIINETGEYYE